MAGQFRTDNIGRYLADMQTTIKSTDFESLAEIDPKFKAKYDEFKRTKDEKVLKSLNKILRVKQGEATARSYSKIAGNRNRMIQSCLPLVYHVAKYYLNRAKNERVTVDDLIQAGNVGLIIAADKYLTTPIDTKATPRIAKFSAYAYFWIKKYVMEESFRNATMMSGTVRDVEHATRNTHTVGSDPYSEMNSEDSGKSTSPWDKLSLAGAKEVSTYEKDLMEIKLASKDLFRDLKKEEKRVLFLVYGIDTPTGLPYTFEEAGKMISRSKSAVSRMVASAIYKMQNRLKTTQKAKDVLATLSLLHGVDLSSVKEWTIADTY